MKKIIAFALLSAIASFSFAQDKKMDKIVNAKEVERIEKVLSSDDMKGRATFSPDIDRAADFIASEFKKTGLKTWNNSGSYLQVFAMATGTVVSENIMIDGVKAESNKAVAITLLPELNINEKSGFEKVYIAKGANLNTEARKYTTGNKNYLVIVDTSFSKAFAGLAGMKSRQRFKSDKSVLFVLATTDPKTWSVTGKYDIKEQKLQNVVGMLPGKSRKNEYVIFSGHYDHLGVRAKDRQGNILPDSIYNGANDDAAGTTSMMILAEYFKALKNNERTIIFVAFTAEEVGGFGSQYFSRQFDPAQVMAMFNLEMTGTESKWGRNSAYITGYERTDMGKILQGNLEGTGFTFYPDPYTTQNLFYRSDNATLARLGVPAHTISTSKMDNEPNYHKPSDEIGTLDMENMAMIIKAVALSSRGIISGKETPSRVDTSTLR